MCSLPLTLLCPCWEPDLAASPARLPLSNHVFLFQQYAGIEPVDKVNTEVKPFMNMGTLLELP